MIIVGAIHMAVTVQIDPAREDHQRGARQQGLPTILLALLLASLLATGVSVAAFFVPGAVVSALFVGIFYALMVAIKLRDRRVWARTTAGSVAVPGAPAQDEPDTEEIAPDIAREIVAAERAGFRLGVIIVAPIAALAVVLAAIFVGWKLIGLGALAIFALMILFGAPVWLAAVEDDIEEAAERTGVETHSIR